MKKSTAKDDKEKKEPTLLDELYASETRYRCLFQSTKDGILILDADTGKIVDVNPFLIDLLGYSKNEFIEKSIWDIGAFQDIIENKEKFLELQQKEYLRYDDLPLETSNGSKINVEFVSNVYLANNFKVIQCQIRDITARKEAEAVLEKTRKELAEIKKTTDELNKLTENIVDTVREPLLAIDKSLRVIKASRSFYEFFKVTATETIGKHIYQLGNRQWDIPRLKELLEEIIPEKESFDNYEVEHHFTTIGKRVMLLNARQVKRAFGNEKVILLAIEDITERKEKENTLKEKHRATSDFLNTLLNFMHAPIIIWDASLVIKRFNRKFEQLSGYDSAEVIDKKIELLFPKDKVAATLALLKNHLKDEHDVIEIDILTKDQCIKTVLWNSSRILDEKGKKIIATISQDITSRKRTEDALNFSETRYRRLFESAKDGILILDSETGKIVDVNPFLVNLLGYSRDEFIEKSIWEIGSFKDVYENKEKFLELQQNEYVRYDDLPLETSDGRIVHVEFVSNVYLANNAKVIQCNIRDNTERKKIQDEIKFQADLINNVGQAVIATDLLGKVIYWNNAAESIYG
jgi:PAS domain S-box-containing protein